MNLSTEVIKAHMNKCDSIPVMSREEERKAFEQYHAGDKSMKDKLLLANQRFIYAECVKFNKTMVPFDDLFQEANVGFIKAIEKYDPSRNLRLITYARWWVRRALQTAVTEQERITQLPNNYVGMFNCLKWINEFENKTRRIPTTDECMEEGGFRLCESAPALAFKNLNHYLDQSTSTDGESTMYDVLAGAPGSDDMKQESQRQLVDVLLTGVSPEQLEAAYTKYLKYGREITLREASKDLGVTTQAISHRLEHAFRAIHRKGASALCMPKYAQAYKEAAESLSWDDIDPAFAEAKTIGLKYAS